MPRGVPQIEVTYDIDANGILNVSAVEKSTGKENKITITNDKGRLSKDEVERMVSEAEKYKNEDAAMKEKIEAKNSLENYSYQVRNTIDEPAFKDKLSDDDKKTIEEASKAVISWLDEHQDEEKEVYEEKMKELQGTVNPIMQKVAGGAGGAGGMPGGMPPPGSTGPGPKIEEVD